MSWAFFILVSLVSLSSSLGSMLGEGMEAGAAVMAGGDAGMEAAERLAWVPFRGLLRTAIFGRDEVMAAKQTKLITTVRAISENKQSTSNPKQWLKSELEMT